MNFEFNVFATILLIIGSANLFLAIVLFQRIGGVVKWFSALMFAVSIWSIAYAFELASLTLEQMLLFIKIEYLGISFLPSIWIIFTIKFIGKNHWFTSFNVFIIFIFPIIDFILVQTNSSHLLHYASVWVDKTGSFPLLAIKPGIAYTIHTVYFYFMLIWGVYLLVIALKKGYSIYQKQYISIIFAALVPWFTNLVYLFGYRPFGHIDLTPYAFILTSSIIAFSLLRYSLFNLIPIAREKVIEHMTEGVIILDWQNRILDFNAVVLKFLKVKDINLIGLNLLDIVEQKSELESNLKNPQQQSFILPTHNRFFEVSINRVNESKGIYTGSLVIFRDITDGKVAKEKLEKQTHQLEELNLLKDKLFSIIAHDLKAPFASLLSMLRIVGEEGLTAEEFKQFLPKLTENVDYTSTMLENLLNWSRSQIDAVNIDLEPILLQQLVANETVFFSKKASEKSIQIINELSSDLVVNADRNTVQLIFRNLFSNAIKFCRENDTISISSQIIEEKETIVFKDSGIGMSNEKLKKLFSSEIFTTLGTDNEKGTGLGLLLCKDFLNKTGGKIHVESGVGVGTTFYIQFGNN